MQKSSKAEVHADTWTRVLILSSCQLTVLNAPSELMWVKVQSLSSDIGMNLNWSFFKLMQISELICEPKFSSDLLYNSGEVVLLEWALRLSCLCVFEIYIRPCQSLLPTSAFFSRSCNKQRGIKMSKMYALLIGSWGCCIQTKKDASKFPFKQLHTSWLLLVCFYCSCFTSQAPPKWMHWGDKMGNLHAMMLWYKNRNFSLFGNKKQKHAAAIQSAMMSFWVPVQILPPLK